MYMRAVYPNRPFVSPMHFKYIYERVLDTFVCIIEFCMIWCMTDLDTVVGHGKQIYVNMEIQNL